MRSRGPGRSPSRNRALSYAGPAFLKCATVSRVPPSTVDGGSVAPPSTNLPGPEHDARVQHEPAGGGAPRGSRTRHPTTPRWAPGPPAAFSWSLRPTSAQGLPHKLPWAAVGFLVPTPPARRQCTALLGSPAGVLSYTTGSTCAPSLRPECGHPTRSWSCVQWSTVGRACFRGVSRNPWVGPGRGGDLPGPGTPECRSPGGGRPQNPCWGA